jgi:hypothetical protein
VNLCVSEGESAWSESFQKRNENEFCETQMHIVKSCRCEKTSVEVRSDCSLVKCHAVLEFVRVYVVRVIVEMEGF